jgi:predicted transcriptional regulator
VVRRLLGQVGDPFQASVYARWHKEIFADLAALLLGGPAAAWGMAEFLAQPGPRTLTYRPGGAHPTAYLRAMVLAEMLRRMGFPRHATHLTGVWNKLYDPARGHRLPARLLTAADRTIPQVVDEIAFQTRRNLAQRALADIIPFSREDEAAIRAGARQLARGEVRDVDLAPRHLVSAAAYALAAGRIEPARLSRMVIEKLNGQTAADHRQPLALAA